MYYIVIMCEKPPLEWDNWNIEHIKKHAVTKEEVEEVYRTSTKLVQSYKKRKLILGKTKVGRLLTVVISYEKQINPYVVSARDMSQKERRIYYEQTKTDKTV